MDGFSPVAHKEINKKTNNYLLTIAIDDYEYFNTLNNAVKDIEEITDILVNLYQFKPEHVHQLFNEEATEDSIDEKFLELVDVVTEEDNLVIFFSGHGYYRDNVQEGYWVPVNGRKDKVSDYISNANLIRYLQNIKAHHLLLVVDSCFSGSLVEQLRGEPNSEGFPSRRVFASGRTELVSDGIPGENSPFAKGIIDFLKANTDRQLSTTSMIESVRIHVNRVTKQWPIEGRLRDSKDNRGEFFFRRKLLEQDLWNTTLAKGTLNAFEGFLRIFPTGQYSEAAYEHLERQRTLLAWNKAEENNTIYDYEDFILMHPDSNLVVRAKAKIELNKQTEEIRLKTEEERLKRIEEEQKQEEELLRLAKKYREHFLEAQEAFKQNNYRKARRLLYECEKMYREKQERFIPSIDNIKEKREECTRHLIFEEYVTDGRRSFRTKDYKTAVKFFNEALALKLDDEIIKLRDAALSFDRAVHTITIDVDQRKKKPDQAPPVASPPIIIKESTENLRPSLPKISLRPQTRGNDNETTTQSQSRPSFKKGRRNISVQAGKKDTAKRRPFINQPPKYHKETFKPPEKEKRDLTWLYVFLLVVTYFIIAKVLLHLF